MKKFLITISIVCILLITGCYKEDTATVRINLSNMPVAQNIQQKTFLDRIRSFFVKDAYAATPDLFIAALKGNKPLAVVKINHLEVNNSIVEMEVPAGDGITIVVLFNNSLYYYGNITVNLTAGKEVDLTFNLINSLNDELEFWYEQIINYNPISGVTKYILEGFAGNGPWQVIYEGMDLPVNKPSGYDSFQVYLNFDYFNVTCGPY